MMKIFIDGIREFWPFFFGLILLFIITFPLDYQLKEINARLSNLEKICK